jgi:hypothetical protein
MSLTIISIPKELELYFLGRNDYGRMCGVIITHFRSNDVLHLEPITSRGIPGRCSMEIPVKQMEEFIAALRTAAGMPGFEPNESVLSMDKLIATFGPWGEHPNWPRSDWQREAANGDTQRGYWDHVAARLEEEEADKANTSTSAEQPSFVQQRTSVTDRTWSTAGIDRLLGLADQFLEEWAEDAVQTGNRDAEYEERKAEWSAVRPLLLSAPALLKGLEAIATFCHGSSNQEARHCEALARESLAEVETTTSVSRSSHQ